MINGQLLGINVKKHSAGIKDLNPLQGLKVTSRAALEAEDDGDAGGEGDDELDDD